MLLETSRLILRKWELANAEEYYKLAMDPRVASDVRWQQPADLEDSRRIIRENLLRPDNFAIVLKDTGRIIGGAGLLVGSQTERTERDDECELYYWLGVPYWGSGYATEAAIEMVRHAFIELRMRKVWCSFSEDNAPSKRVQEKVGFRYYRTDYSLSISDTNTCSRTIVTYVTTSTFLSD